MKEIYVKVGDMYVRTYNHPFIEFSFNREDAAKYDKLTAAKIVATIGTSVARLVELEMVPTEKVYEIDEVRVVNGRVCGFSQHEIGEARK